MRALSTQFRSEPIAAPNPSKKHKSDVNIFHGGPFAAIYKEHGTEPMPPLNRYHQGECWVEQNKTYRPSKFFNRDGSLKEGAAAALEKLNQCWKDNITVLVQDGRDLQHLEALKGTHTLKFGPEFNQPLDHSLSNLTNVTTLAFGENFNHPLGDSLNNLTNLTTLESGRDFNQPLDHSLDNLTNLTSLTFGYLFNQPLGHSLDNLTNLTTLTFGWAFYQDLDDSLDNLTNVTTLKFPRLDKPLGDSLKNLTNLTSLTRWVVWSCAP